MEALVHDDPAEAAAHRVATLVGASDERFSLGLAGGSTPAAMYEILRDLDVHWANVDLWLSDERWVDWDDERSNGRMAKEILVDHVEASFRRPRWSDSLEPRESAAQYEKTIRSGVGQPDLVLLGVGADGHTASLFPDSPALVEDESWYVSNVIPRSGETRLTATYPLLWSARHLIVLAMGSSKAPAVRDSFEGKTPAGRVGEGEAVVEWHLDRDAASLLS